MIDQFFTPEHIASHSLIGLEDRSLNVVADFSIGEGSFIKALPLPASTVIGIDIDKKVIERLKKEFPSWHLRNDNFLERKPSTEKWLANWKRKIDLIILNPPFSSKGCKHLDIAVEGVQLKCRKALAFVVKALEYLSPEGTLIAILPLSTTKSEMDLVVLNYIKSRWSVVFGSRFSRNTFDGCFPHSILLTIKKKTGGVAEKTFQVYKQKQTMRVQIIRGSIRMYKTKETGKFKVIHTTNLKNNLLTKSCFYRSNTKIKSVIGTFICIPRVGNPSIDKVVLVEMKTTHLISDCIIALKADSEVHTRYLKDLLVSKWDEFRKLYESTCAPYITLSQVINFLRSQNISSEVVFTFEPNPKSIISTCIPMEKDGSIVPENSLAMVV